MCFTLNAGDNVRTPDHGDVLHQMLQFITAQRRLDVPVLRALFHFQKGISEGQAEQHKTPGKKSNLKTDSLLYCNSSKEAARDMHLLLSPLQSMSAPLSRTAKTRDCNCAKTWRWAIALFTRTVTQLRGELP